MLTGPSSEEHPMIAVLLVEPHHDTRELYAEFLQGVGFTVHATANTDEACELVSHADLRVTGLQVPGRIDGLELIRRLRSDPATQAMPIVVVTASVYSSAEQAARGAGCDLFLKKPCLPADLATAIRHAAMLRLGRSVTLKAKRG
jgi:two-component system, cell cycle response regulator DivK